MVSWVNVVLDLTLICFVAVGLLQAGRLLRQLSGLRQGRLEMERFVQEFSAAIMRAENGIKDLRNAARISGDDLEKLLDKATSMRDELHFIIESADQIAARLTSTASTAVRPNAKAPASQNESSLSQKSSAQSAMPVTPKPTISTNTAPSNPSASQHASRAEQELMQALEKLG